MNSDEVIRYLKENPNFFEEHAETISKFSIPHPYGGSHIISITERQLLSLRDQNKALESKIQQLIHFGEENDIRGEKMHRLSVALIVVTTLQSMVQVLNFYLHEDLAVPHTAIRLWVNPENWEDHPEFAPVSEELRDLIEGLAQPYCGTVADFDSSDALKSEVLKLFDQKGQEIKSQALIALRNSGGSMGVIALGSEEDKRFYAGMGTLYLERLGEMISAAVARILR